MPSSDYATVITPPAKRRQIRKGTFSCWECKGRKIRCEFNEGAGVACVSCRRRGLPCISQELLDPSDEPSLEVGNRISHVESLFNRLVQQRRGPTSLSGQSSISNINAIRSDESLQMANLGRNYERSPLLSKTLPDPERLLTGSRSLSDQLRSIMPHPTKAAMILSQGRFSSLPIHIHRHPSRLPQSLIQTADQITDIASSTAHPVQFARTLVQLALCLHHLDDTTSLQLESELGEQVHDAALRFVRIAHRYVTSQDSLMESLEGLETVMLEGCFYINIGDLRAAWMAFRRGLGIGQLLGLPYQVRNTGSEGEDAWFRLMCGERFLAFRLGISFGMTDTDDPVMSSSQMAPDAHAARIDRINVVLLGRIIARNVRLKHRLHGNISASQNESDGEQKETREIDSGLKLATRSVPAQWWVFPTIEENDTDAERIGKMSRIVARMHHQFLLIALHQPYCIYQLCQRICIVSPFSNAYSQIAILSACREVLSSFLAIRPQYRYTIYRGLDDKAFTAATMLLILHFNGHGNGDANVLEHQRPHDIGLVNGVVKCLEDMSSPSKDMITEHAVKGLVALLRTEADAANGVTHSSWMETGPAGMIQYEVIQDEHGLRVQIPYFGTLRITYQRERRPFDADPALREEFGGNLTLYTNAAEDTSAHSASISTARPIRQQNLGLQTPGIDSAMVNLEEISSIVADTSQETSATVWGLDAPSGADFGVDSIFGTWFDEDARRSAVD